MGVGGASFTRGKSEPRVFPAPRLDDKESTVSQDPNITDVKRLNFSFGLPGLLTKSEVHREKDSSSSCLPKKKEFGLTHDE